jgi:hypothetical protein
MTPDAITLLFREARKAFPPFKGKPTDNNLTAIRETLLPILMEIPYNQLGGVHSLTAILTDPMRYAANHGGAAFKCPARLPLYDKNIADNAMTIICVRAESAHRARLDNYASYEAAERGAAKFLHEVVNKVWYNDLKDADTFYTKVLALEIMAFLDADSGGLHANNMITLCTNMHGYYAQVDGIPQYIIMLEEAQKKAKRAGMPIANIKLIMMALAAILAAEHFPCKVDNWEGLPANSRLWAAWKMAFRLAHLKHQHQSLALGGGSLSVGLMVCFLRQGRRSSGLKWLEAALKNLALVATNDMTVVQQLTATNLALTATVGALTATNKKLVDAASCPRGPPVGTPAGGAWPTKNPFPGNYCWTHGHRICKEHTSATCNHRAIGHRAETTALNTLGGSKKDKGWSMART